MITKSVLVLVRGNQHPNVAGKLVSIPKKVDPSPGTDSDSQSDGETEVSESRLKVPKDLDATQAGELDTDTQ